jgi:hypothetical protein
MRKTTTPLPFLSTLALAVAASGCAGQPLRPYVFDGALAPEGATANLVRALHEMGRPTAIIDPRAGVIVTSWADTGYRFHESPVFPDDLNGEVEKYIFRRYRLAILPRQTGAAITVRLQAEVKRCLPPVSLVQEQLVGQCEDAPVGFRSLQRDLEALGQRLQVLAVERPAPGSVP